MCAAANYRIAEVSLGLLLAQQDVSGEEDGCQAQQHVSVTDA